MVEMLSDLTGKSILLVEDDYLAVTDLVPGLNSIGVRVVGPAPTVEDALQVLQGAPNVSGAILDINLGGQTVFPLADELDRRRLPFLFATGYESDIVPPRHADKPFLQKPYDMRAIASALQSLHTRPRPDQSQAKRNAILSLLPQADLEQILPLLRPVTLPSGTVIETEFEYVRNVYFPISFVASVIAASAQGRKIEAGLVGREGVTGFGIADGDRSSPYKLLTQSSGDGLMMSSDDFAAALEARPNLARLVHRFSRSLAIQVSFTALANGRFELPQRLARWLLMLQDRIGGDALTITHDHLSIMLGVRRPGVTNALHILEGERLIRSHRGEVLIVDRPGLIRFSADSYGLPEGEYLRLMGVPLKMSLQ